MYSAEQHIENHPGGTLRRVLRREAFCLLWAGQGTSYVGDQFYLVALPWLVLQLTGDPVALGGVLAAVGVPRALIMLLGGAVTDRFSPRTVMIASDMARLALTVLMAAIIAAGTVQLWSLYLFAVAFGAASGFFLPASNTIVPRVLDREELQTGNALLQGTGQIAAFLGPLLAGGTIALLGGSLGQGNQAVGIAVAFAVDALTFLVSIFTLWMMGSHTRRRPDVSGQGEAQGREDVQPGISASIIEGLRYAWSNVLLRTVLVVVALMNMLIMGPLLVGIPVLADRQLPEGAAALGVAMAAFACGNLIGYVLAGSLPKPKRPGLLVPPILAAFGLILAAIGVLNTMPALALALFGLGTGSGYLTIVLVTWLQQRTPQALLGRVMSLLLFANMGLLPVGQALAGIVVEWSLTGLFIGAGALVLGVAALLLLFGDLRRARL